MHIKSGLIQPFVNIKLSQTLIKRKAVWFAIGLKTFSLIHGFLTSLAIEREEHNSFHTFSSDEGCYSLNFAL